MIKRIISLTFIIIYSSVYYGYSQYEEPLKIPLVLSANFGELRNNHFHSGIDIKTEGVINKPVYSIADGYISRIGVSPGGYGLALYVTHPGTQQVSLYGHLEKFAPKIAKHVKEKQYEQESYRINLLLEENIITVKKGELIAYSGNTGSSGGPHLHFEIRDAKTEEVLDPLPFYAQNIRDNIPPDLRGVAVYPLDGKGVVNNDSKPLRQNITKTKSGEYSPLKTSVNAWGMIGIGVKAYDKMTGTTNIYGVKKVRLYVDDNKIFESDIDAFSFDNTRMLNSFIDFEDWRRNNSFYMKSFIEPGNNLPFYKAVNNGYITIDEERTYKIKYELEDLYGNVTRYSFRITGKKQAIPVQKKGAMYMVWNQDNHFINEDFSLIIPKGNLYNDFIFTFAKNPTQGYFSDKFLVNDVPVPFHKEAEIKIRLHTDTLVNKSQYGIISLQGSKEKWIGGIYSEGYLTATIKEAGETYTVSSDKKAPVIAPIQPETWTKQSKIRIKVTDDKSGVLLCKATIDGKFALFENDIKSAVHVYNFDSERLEKGKTHQLVFTASDACGNTAEYITEFYY